jgi:hypothetical protein
MSPGPSWRNMRGTPTRTPRRRFSAATVTSSPRMVEPPGKECAADRRRRVGESRAAAEIFSCQSDLLGRGTGQMSALP